MERWHRWVGLGGVQLLECCDCGRRLCAQAVGEKGCAGFTVEAFPGQASSKLFALVGSTFTATGGQWGPAAFPKASPFARLPPLQAIQRVGRHGLGVFAPSALWGIKDRLRKHEQFLPSPDVVVVGSCCKGSGQHFPPQVAGCGRHMSKRAGAAQQDCVE